MTKKEKRRLQKEWAKLLAEVTDLPGDMPKELKMLGTAAEMLRLHLDLGIPASALALPQAGYRIEVEPGKTNVWVISRHGIDPFPINDPRLELNSDSIIEILQVIQQLGKQTDGYCERLVRLQAEITMAREEIRQAKQKLAAQIKAEHPWWWMRILNDVSRGRTVNSKYDSYVTAQDQILKLQKAVEEKQAHCQGLRARIYGSYWNLEGQIIGLATASPVLAELLRNRRLCLQEVEGQGIKPFKLASVYNRTKIRTNGLDLLSRAFELAAAIGFEKFNDFVSFVIEFLKDQGQAAEIIETWSSSPAPATAEPAPMAEDGFAGLDLGPTLDQCPDGKDSYAGKAESAPVAEVHQAPVSAEPELTTSGGGAHRDVLVTGETPVEAPDEAGSVKTVAEETPSSVEPHEIMMAEGIGDEDTPGGTGQPEEKGEAASMGANDKATADAAETAAPQQGQRDDEGKPGD